MLMVMGFFFDFGGVLKTMGPLLRRGDPTAREGLWDLDYLN
jgi:hypothetical protein